MNGTRTLGERLTRRKPVEMLMSDTAGADAEHGHLKRGITPFQLTMFGVGSTIGTGIFFVLAETVPTAGPAVILSFVSAAAVAVGWSGYLNKVFEIVFGAGLPPALLSAPLVADGYDLSIGGEGVI